MRRLRYAACLILPLCLAPLLGCGATSVSASLSAGPAYYGPPVPCDSSGNCSEDVIESRIDGDFVGWSGDTTFILENGQVWRQATYAYTYYYAYRPAVTIYQYDSVWYLKVEGLNESLPVEPLY